MTNKKSERILLTIAFVIIALLSALIIILTIKENSKGDVNEENRQNLITKVQKADRSAWDSEEREDVNNLSIYVIKKYEKANTEEEINKITDLYNKEINEIPDRAAKNLVFQETLEKVQKAGDENDQKDIKYIINTEKQDVAIETTEDMADFLRRVAKRLYEARGTELEVPTAEQIEKAAKEKTSDHTIN